MVADIYRLEYVIHSRISRNLGNHMRRLLTNTGPEEMVKIIEGSPISKTMLKLFRLLGEIQAYARSAFLSQEEVKELDGLANTYFTKFRVWHCFMALLYYKCSARVSICIHNIQGALVNITCLPICEPLAILGSDE